MRAHKMGDTAFLKYNTALFKKVAPYYDGLDLLIGHVRHDFARFVAPSPGARILDSATGTGKQAFAFGRAGHAVVGIDLSPDMLAVARRKNRFPAIGFLLADATALPFKDGAFDITSMSFALHCMPPAIRLQAVLELKRVTRANGSVAFVDYRLPVNRFGRQFAYSVIGLYETDYWRDFVRSDFEALLSQAGLRV